MGSQKQKEARKSSGPYSIRLQKPFPLSDRKCEPKWVRGEEGRWGLWKESENRFLEPSFATNSAQILH